MSFIDWIPIVSTIKHSFENPEGLRVSDYTCHMDNAACAGDPAVIASAKAVCEREIDKQLLDFLKKYCGGGILDAVYARCGG